MEKKEFSFSQKEIIWARYFGNDLSGPDAFGRVVSKGNYICVHIYPETLGGQTTVENGIALCPLSAEEKQQNTDGVINGKSYEVKGTPERSRLYVDGEIKSK